MVDVVPQDVRSRMMSGIRAADTRPEMLLRRGLHGLGFRFRLHAKNLPGRPDIVFPRYKAVIFVHGCFWHGHDCHLFKWPSTRSEFWRKKIERNQYVDLRAAQALGELGWRVGVVWECATKGKSRRDLADLLGRCEKWLRFDRKNLEVRGH
jgi:DNA mismatch endonuclease, patch repair protein